MRVVATRGLLLLLILVLLAGCGNAPEDVADGDSVAAPQVSTASPAQESGATGEPSATTAPTTAAGQSLQVIEETIGPDGGVIVLGETGGPLAGLSIDVPAGAYAEETRFTVSHRPFDGDLPEHVTALTPLIVVENGGEYANEVMTVTIPIDLPEYHFAMGFFAHEDGSLEGMPIVALSQDSITVASRHFSSFLIAMIADAILEEPVDAGFRPGADDWQFPNYGSYIEPDGHCAGMSITAMWYYLERHLKGEPHLYGRYDNNGGARTPDLWEDDSYAYRLASVVQKDIDWGSVSRKLFTALADTSDTVTWKSFLFSMHVTHEPQYVSIANVTGGHAMIVYAVDVERGELCIADPNYGGQERRIQFVDGKFLPYMSAENVLEALAGHYRMYEQIRYNAKTGLVPWDKVSSRWAELNAGTIGDDVFPDYGLTYPREPKCVGCGTPPFVDGMSYTYDRIMIFCRHGADLYLYDAYTLTGQPAGEDENDYLLLQPGENQLGLAIVGQSAPDKWRYVDFQRISVVREARTVQVELEVQAHATVRRVNQPDPSVGFEGQDIEHDTPFEMITFTAYDGASVSGQTYRAVWKDVPNAEGDGFHTGKLDLELNEDKTEIVSFSASNVLAFTDGTTSTSRVSGRGVPAAEGKPGVFLVTGPEVCGLLSEFDDDWAFDSGNTREVTGFTCDEHSIIRVTIR